MVNFIVPMGCSKPSEKFNDIVKRGLEKMIDNDLTEMKKVVVTPYPNKDIKVLALSEVPNRFFGYEVVLNIERTQRGKKRKEIYIVGGLGLWLGGFGSMNWLQFYKRYTMHERKRYNYFNKLLEEADL